MPVAFVTGATGFLGRHLIECLLEEGWEAVVLHRAGSEVAALAALGVELRQGDVTKGATLRNVVPEQADCVFHMAADTSTWKKHRKRQRRINVVGTRNMVHAALDAGVKRFVHTSTVAVFGPQPGLIDETAPHLGETSWVGYVQTKAKAELVVKTAVHRGLDAAICNPAHILGRYDTTGWAQLFLKLDRGKLPGIPPGAGCFANARDVARAHIRAAERGKTGQNYILGGPHHSFAEVIGAFARLLEKDPPTRIVPKAMLKFMGHLQQFGAVFTRKEPNLTPEAAYFVSHDQQYSSAKAEKQLGYRPAPLAQSLAECHAWLVESGLIGANARTRDRTTPAPRG